VAVALLNKLYIKVLQTPRVTIHKKGAPKGEKMEAVYIFTTPSSKGEPPPRNNF